MRGEVSSYGRKISDSKYAVGSEYERTSKQYMLDLVPRGVFLKILDVGCGTGLNTRALRERGHKVVGVDISEKAIEKFRRAGFDGECCDVVEGLPFEEASFDLVYVSEVIEHISDTDAFLAEVYRVLRPSGKLLLSTHAQHVQPRDTSDGSGSS